jgi:hypothetical protein
MKTSLVMEKISMLRTELEKQAGFCARLMFNIMIMREVEYYGKIFGLGILSVVTTFSRWGTKKGES